MSRRLLRRNSNGTRLPDLRALAGDSGIDNLSPYLTINSQTVAPTFVYRGADATATSWPGYWGEDLSIAGSGTAPSLNQPALGNGDNDFGVKIDGGEHYAESGTTSGDISSNDFTSLFVGSPDGTTSVIVAKRDGGVGWEIGIDASDRIYITIQDSGGSVSVVSAALSVGSASMCRLFADRSGSAQWYVNGVASGAAVAISGVALSLSNTEPLTAGATSGGSSVFGGDIVYMGVWQGSSWFSTHLNATDAAEEYYRWSGIWPDVTTGTAMPNTFTRASQAYAQKWNSAEGAYNLISCAPGVPRVDWVKDGSEDFKGMLIEPQATNLVTYSNDIDTGWSKARITINTSTGIATPDVNVDYQGAIASVDNATHPIYTGVTTTADDYCFSVIAQKGVSDYLRLSNTTIGSVTYFDLNNQSVVSTSGTVSTGIIDMGNDDVLLWIVVTCTAATNQFYMYLSMDGISSTFAGDGASVYTYLGFAQVELGSVPSSRIVTAGATVTRAADQLQYNGDNVTAGQGAYVGTVLVDDHDPAAELSLIAISDGGSANEMIRGYVDAGTQVPIFEGIDSSVSQWSITGATDVLDGSRAQVRGTWDTDSAKQFVRKLADGTPDTSCTVPTGLDEIDVGCDVSGANQLNGRIRDLQIWGWDEENLG